MKRWLLVLVASAGLGAAAAPAEAKAVLESSQKTYPAASVRTLNLEFTVGALRVRGTDGDEVSVRLLVHCKRDNDRCADFAEDVRLDTRTRGDRMDISVEGHAGFRGDDYWVEGLIEVPSRMRLDIEMPVGEVSVRGMESDVELRLKVGEVTVEMPEAAVANVDAGVTIGEATLDRRGGHQQVEGPFAGKLRWRDGRGTARVRVDLGVGELSMRLY